MSSPTADSRHAESLSALMDGQLDSADVKRLTQAWAQDEQARQDWHAYHLIGDCLRSEELAQSPGHDRAFLAKLSARLAEEPLVLAPQTPVAPEPVAVALQANGAPSRARWAAPMTVAAGFMVVAAALVTLQGGPQEADRSRIAQAPAPSPVATQLGGLGLQARNVSPQGGTVLAAAAASAQQPQVGMDRAPVYVVNGQMVRDARLDRYLQAHKEFAAGAPLGMSAGYVRNVGIDSTQP